MMADERVAARRCPRSAGRRRWSADGSMRTKSRLTVVRSASAMPRLRASATAFRNTSGSTTADPQFRYTPRSSRATFDDEVAEVAQAALAERRARRRRMHVDDVGADRHVHRDRNAEARRPRRARSTARAAAARSCRKRATACPMPEPAADAVVDRAVQQAAGFVGHAERARAERLVDVLGGRAGRARSRSRG